MAYIHVPTMRYPLRERHIRAENPNTSFSSNFRPPDGYEKVVATDPPTYDELTSNIKEAKPVLVDGAWVQDWIVYPASNDEIAQRKSGYVASIKSARAAAYKDEADPIFFKAQRNEATIEEWTAKVNEIRARHPYPDWWTENE